MTIRKKRDRMVTFSVRLKPRDKAELEKLAQSNNDYYTEHARKVLEAYIHGGFHVSHMIEEAHAR